MDSQTLLQKMFPHTGVWEVNWKKKPRDCGENGTLEGAATHKGKQPQGEKSPPTSLIQDKNFLEAVSGNQGKGKGNLERGAFSLSTPFTLMIDWLLMIWSLG